MDEQVTAWKLLADQFWSAEAPDYREAAQLAAEIAGANDDALRRAALQVLPNLRSAMATHADHGVKDLALRRFSVLRDRLHTLTAPRFGKRGHAAEPLTPQQNHREMLGLPPGRRLSGPEIHDAYKRAAKSHHPDGGGNAHEFVKLSEARDALMKER